MAITTTSVLSAPVQQSFAHKLLSVPVPNLIHNLAADRKTMPRNGGTTLRMRRYNPLPTSLVPLGKSIAQYKFSLIDLEPVVALS